MLSYSHTDLSQMVTKEVITLSVDQVEIDWMFNFGKVTAQVDLEY